MTNTQLIDKRLLDEFKRYLEAKGVSARSKSNYLSDVKHFGQYYPTLEVGSEQVGWYLNHLLSSNMSAVSVNRRMSTLRHLAKFQNKTYMDGVQNVAVEKSDNILDGFVKHLLECGLGARTIANYKSDVGHFIGWLEARDVNVDSVDSIRVREYLIDIKSTASEATTKRKIASIRKLLSWRYGGRTTDTETGTNAQMTFGLQKRPAVPAILMLAVVILLIVQVFVGEKIESPWSDVIASDSNNVELGSGLDEVEMPIESKQTNLVLTAKQEVSVNEEVLSLEEQQVSDAYGTGMIAAGKREMVISNSAITPYSYIYITPTTSTKNQAIYVSEQGVGYFVAMVDLGLSTHIEFNWWSINH